MARHGKGKIRRKLKKIKMPSIQTIPTTRKFDLGQFIRRITRRK